MRMHNIPTKKWMRFIKTQATQMTISIILKEITKRILTSRKKISLIWMMKKIIICDEGINFEVNNDNKESEDHRDLGA